MSPGSQPGLAFFVCLDGADDRRPARARHELQRQRVCNLNTFDFFDNGNVASSGFLEYIEALDNGFVLKLDFEDTPTRLQVFEFGKVQHGAERARLGFRQLIERASSNLE
jgi:hypothetical protein